GDGVRDMVIAISHPWQGTAQGEVARLPGHADGTVSVPTCSPAGLNPLGGVLGDLDGDQKPAPEVTDFNSSAVSVLSLLGNGQLGAHRAAAGTPYDVNLADVNGDGRPDLRVSQGGPAGLDVCLGVGGGAFSSPANLLSGYSAGQTIVADITGDGVVDIVTVTS